MRQIFVISTAIWAASCDTDSVASRAKSELSS